MKPALGRPLAIAKNQADKPGTEPCSYLAIAHILKPQGRRGEVFAEIMTDFPERFQALNQVYLEDGGNSGHAPRPLGVENAWPHKGQIVLKFAGVDTIDEAERLRGLHVLVPFEERVPLPEGSYYWSELQGCRVVMEVDGTLEEVGTVTGVEPTAGVPLLHVTRDAPGHNEVLVPLARDICKKIDPGTKRVVIDPPEDLLDLNS